MVFSKKHKGYNGLVTKKKTQARGTKEPKSQIKDNERRVGLFIAGDLVVIKKDVRAIPNKLDPGNVETLWEGNMPLVKSGSTGIILRDSEISEKDDFPWVLALIEEQELILPTLGVKIIQQSSHKKNNGNRPKNG